MRLFYILFLNEITNHSLKIFFSLPRPLHLDPNLGLIHVDSFGFPSGAAQNTILLACIFINYIERPWKWAAAAAYVILISFSRIYLGVHFGSDILGGWLFGFSLYLLYTYIYPALEEKIEMIKPSNQFYLSQIVPIALLCLFYSKPVLQTTSVAMGLGAGLMILHYYRVYLTSPLNAKEYCFRALIGSIGTFIVYYLTAIFLESKQPLPNFIQFFLLGIWVSLGSPLLCRRWLSCSTLRT